jgi:hypothetical protein
MNTAADRKVCPFLRIYYDAEPFSDLPNVANQCRVREPPLAIELYYQTHICMKGNWTACPRYEAILAYNAALAGASQESLSEQIVSRELDASPRTRTGPGRGLLGCVLVGVLVPVIALCAGVMFLLFPAMFPTGTLAPTSASSLRQTIATSTLTSTPSPSPVPTSSPTGVSSPTITTEVSLALPQPSPVASSAPTATPSSVASSAPTATPSSVASSAPTATPSPTPSPPPTAAPTIMPTASPIPTATASATSAPTRTPKPAPRVTKQASPTPTKKPTAVQMQFPQPVLLDPVDGQVFWERDEIVLRWQPLGQLPPDAYYVITVAYSHFGDTWYDEIPWTRDTSWAVSEHQYLLGLSEDGWFRWSIQVMRRAGAKAGGGPTGTALSPMSQVRSFAWKTAAGGGQATPEAPQP